tara:strand:+ start:22386 stop:23894 length:1509 start_codon:yes stop_codon:yes gene_type:complete
VKENFRRYSLKKLLQGWTTVSNESEREVTGLCLDSRRILRGEVFVALQGIQTDGREFIDKAIKYGAAAILCEDKGEHLEWTEYQQVPVFYIKDLAKAYGEIAAKFYDNPSKDLTVIGVTGTNGKTSTTHFIAHSLNRLGHRCGVIGTLGNGDIDKLQKARYTTPDAIAVQHCLFSLRAQGFTHVAMEVSSHALAQHRVNGVDFNVAVFTNLTHEHLDFHKTMEGYADAKRSLFENWDLDFSVINADDKTGSQWLRNYWSKKRVYAYSAEGKTVRQIVLEGDVPLVRAANVEFTSEGMSAHVITPWGTGLLNSVQVGQFNLSNLLGVLTVLCLLGERLDDVLEQFESLPQVTGRMQTFKIKDKPLVVIDYSHTPDALEKALQALVQHRKGELWCVFGCGGSRDKTKRPVMGKLAAKYSDYVVLTDDNCREEDPRDIVNDILEGIPESKQAVVEHDRAKAIAYAISHAEADDIVLIAGKGHEDYQEINGERHYFSDIEEVKRLL